MTTTSASSTAPADWEQSVLTVSEEGQLALASVGGVLSSPLTFTATGSTTTWAKGITINSDGSVSGYYDVNKEWGGVDNNMCWAAAASNMLAWWQQTYGTSSLISTSVPTDVEDIFSTFKVWWANLAGSSATGCTWWLNGESNGSSACSGGGGYYAGLLPDNLVDSLTLTNNSATSVATLLSNALEQGGIVSLGINMYDGSSYYMCHAITLWGVSVDDATGQLTSIHVTDSDDRMSGIFTVDVSYDEYSGNYMLHGDRFNNYYLRDFDVLRSLTQTDTTAPSAPTGLAVQVNGPEITFSWSGVKDPSGVCYELAFIKIEGNMHTTYIPYKVSGGETYTTTWSMTGTYRWKLRAKDGAGNTSDWVYGSNFTYDKLAPTLTIDTPQKTVTADNQTAVNFTWSGSNGLSYTLELNGKTYTMGTATKLSLTLADGYYDYSITATDADGYSLTRRGNSFYCDSMKPTSPTGLSVTLQDGKATFSWSASTDANGIDRYAFVYFAPGNSDGIYDWHVDGLSYTLDLPAEGGYSWSVCSFDETGKQSSWTRGSWFTYDATPPTVTLNSVSRVKTAENATSVSFSWSADETATYTLTINGKEYDVGSRTSYTLSLGDGRYQYSVTATDSSGNRTTKAGDAFSLDTIAPALAVSTPTHTKMRTLSWTSEAGATYALTLDGKAVYSGAATSYTPATLAEGSHHYSLTATDAAGNSRTVTGSFTYDITPPALSIGSHGVQKVGAGQSRVTFNWTGETGASYLLSVDGGAAIAVSGTSYTTILGDGEHRYSLTATDAAGNSVTKMGASFTTDTTPPVLSLSASKPSKYAEGKASVTFAWSGDEAASYVLTVDGVQKYKGEMTGYTLTLGDGTHSYSLSATDAAGNTSSRSGELSVDTIAPTQPGSLKASVSAQAGQVTLSWVAAQDASSLTYELLYKHSNATDFIYCNGLRTTGSTLSLPHTGYYNWKVRAVDAAGNAGGWVWGSSFHVTASADTTPPTKPTNLKFGLTQGGRQAVLSWTASTDSSGVTYELAYKHSQAADFTTLTGLTYPAKTIDLPKTGYYNWKIRAVDGKGNATSWVWGSSFNATTVSSESATLTKPTNLKFGLTQQGKQAVLSWTATTGLRYELAYKAATASDFTTLTGLTYPAKTIDLPLTGYYNWKIRAVDGNGNATAWVWGSSFNNIAATSTAAVSSFDASDAVPCLDRELAVSAGASYLAVDSSSVAAPLAACGLSLETDAAKNTLAHSLLA